MKRVWLFLILGLSQVSFGELNVTTYTADDSGFYVNSHLIAGKKDAVLVDAQFNKKNYEKLVLFVKNLIFLLRIEKTHNT